jgi:thiol-disulfide isomerase/thioredoxin
MAMKTLPRTLAILALCLIIVLAVSAIIAQAKISLADMQRPTPSFGSDNQTANASDNDPANAGGVGSRAPNFTVLSASGAKVSLSHFAHKVVVLDFWATWCGPCQDSLPHTDAIARVYQSKGVVFLPICSWDDQASFTSWRQANASMAMKFYYDPAGQDSASSVATKLYGVNGIPAQFVINKHGQIVASFDGYNEFADPTENALKHAIDKAM